MNDELCKKITNIHPLVVIMHTWWSWTYHANTNNYETAEANKQSTYKAIDNDLHRKTLKTHQIPTIKHTSDWRPQICNPRFQNFSKLNEKANENKILMLKISTFAHHPPSGNPAFIDRPPQKKIPIKIQEIPKPQKINIEVKWKQKSHFGNLNFHRPPPLKSQLP